MKQFLTVALIVVAAVSSSGVPATTPQDAITVPVVAAPGTAGSADPLFQQPYIDSDEWRDTPVLHRYVHGGFKGTQTRFSYYLPPKAQYQGRFFQYITPVPDNENLSQGAKGEDDKISFALSSGAYFIETNGGGASMAGGPANAGVDSTIAAYRANAASAQYSRVVALQMYGGKRPFGYAFGGSGGGYRTLGGMENTEGVWDGAVPFVIGSPMAIPNMFTVRMYAQRVLKGKLAQVADAADAGGGDMYAGLNDEERAALTEITKMGFPPRGWYSWKIVGSGAFPVLYPGIVMADPNFFTDFWTKPGYEGFHPPQSLLDARIQHQAKIVKLITADDANAMGLRTRPQMGQARGSANSAWQALIGPDGNQLPVAIQLESVPKERVEAADLLVNTGAAAGMRLPMQRLQDKVAIFGAGGAAAIGALKVGDEVQIDNSNFIAAQTYHRHQVPGPEYHVWDQFRGADGKPLFPQRPMLLGPMFTKSTSGTVNTGKFHGKMIVIENLMDIDAMPWQADWYRNKAQEHFGASLEQNFRLWYTDRANHGDLSRQFDATQTVSYLGVLQQALRDVSAWVEKGIAPPATTAYKIVDGQVVVPEKAAQRRGIQPVIALQANGAERTEVAVSQNVKFTAVIEVPPKTGKIVSVEWDFEGAGTYPVTGELPISPLASVKLNASRAYAKPGTYFAVLRVASQRDGDVKTPFTRIQNLARVRIVVK